MRNKRENNYIYLERHGVCNGTPRMKQKNKKKEMNIFNAGKLNMPQQMQYIDPTVCDVPSPTCNQDDN